MASFTRIPSGSLLRCRLQMGTRSSHGLDGRYRARPDSVVVAAKSSPEERSAAMETVAKRAPVTADRPVSHRDLPLENSQLPRALAAVDAEHLEGTAGRKHNDYTVLQQHCAYFDRDGDGIIFPHETFEGFKALGYPQSIAALAALCINGAFSYPTYDGWVFDPRLPIYLEKIHRTKHGSDTEIYDTEGQFLPSKFEEIFNKYAKTRPNAMTYPEIFHMTNSLRNAYDPFGWAAAKLEWGFTYWLVKDDKGFASKEAVRGIYDGSFFDWVEQEIKKGQSKYDKEVELRKDPSPQQPLSPSRYAQGSAVTYQIWFDWPLEHP